MERLSPESSKELFSDVIQLIGHALRLSPEETIRQVAEWKTENNSFMSTARAVTKMTQESLYAEKGVSTTGSQNFLSAAIDDTGRVTNMMSSQHPQLDTEAIINIMSHPETIQAVAFLALRPDKALFNYTISTLRETGTLTSDESAYVIEDDYLAIEPNGCPAAGYVRTISHEGRVRPAPNLHKACPMGGKGAPSVRRAARLQGKVLGNCI